MLEQYKLISNFFVDNVDNFCNFRKNGPRPRWTIYKHVSENTKKCLSVGNSGILSVIVICRLSSVLCGFTKSTVYYSSYAYCGRIFDF